MRQLECCSEVIPAHFAEQPRVRSDRVEGDVAQLAYDAHPFVRFALLGRPHLTRAATVPPPPCQHPQGFECVRALHLESPDRLFTPDNDLLTPTFKLKRAPLQKRYQGEIDAMYAALKKA